MDSARVSWFYNFDFRESSFMILSNCTCGSEPICEPGAVGARNWDVCCFECGARSAVFPNRTEAVMSWNQINKAGESIPESVPENAHVGGVIDQVIQHIRERVSAI